MRTSWFETSNFVIGPTPDCPATSAFQLVGVSLPNAVTIPRPVTTTRLLIIALPITKAVHAACMSLASAPRPPGAPHHYTPPTPPSRTRERRAVSLHTTPRYTLHTACSRAAASYHLSRQLCRMLQQEIGVGLAASKGLVFQQVQVEGDRRWYAFDHELVERALPAGNGLVARRRPDDEFRQQRVVVRGNLVPTVQMRIHAHARPAGRQILKNRACLRPEIQVRIFRRHPELDGMPAQRHIGLGEIQRLTCRDTELLAHEIQPRHHLRHRVLDLQARIHLHEIVVVVLVHQELHRADAFIAEIEHRFDRPCAHVLPHRFWEARAGRLLQQLLVPALYRAVALAQKHSVAVVVAEHLHLDMLGAPQVLLDVESVVVEGLAHFALGCSEDVRELFRPAY